eukprot:3928908-Pleurochrysis_carterae.AAC.1
MAPDRGQRPPIAKCMHTGACVRWNTGAQLRRWVCVRRRPRMRVRRAPGREQQLFLAGTTTWLARTLSLPCPWAWFLMYLT